MPSLGRVLIFLGSFIVVEVPRLMLFIFFFREIIDLSIGVLQTTQRLSFLGVCLREQMLASTPGHRKAACILRSYNLSKIIMGTRDHAETAAMA